MDTPQPNFWFQRWGRLVAVGLLGIVLGWWLNNWFGSHYVLHNNGTIMLNSRTGKTWIRSAEGWRRFGDEPTNPAPQAVAPPVHYSPPISPKHMSDLEKQLRQIELETDAALTGTKLPPIASQPASRPSN